MQKANKAILSLATVAALAISPLAVSHFNDQEPMQSYRQSAFTLMAMNFGPMNAMLKGEMEWDQKKFERWAEGLDDVAELDILRGFAPGTDKGTTRAKPEIWENMDDFESKMADLQAATEALDDAAETGDREQIAEAFAAAGGACKACHDEYKSKDYLY
jgi:cytochrome c556